MRPFAAVLLLAGPICQAGAASYDLIIRNGHIIDGTGSPWYAADVGITAGRVAAIGGLGSASATRSIDAHGFIVAPGFIDMLGQSELTLLVDPRAPSKIFQGITTEITGEGESVAPLNDTMLRENRSTYQHYGIKVDWHTLAEYFARLEKQGIGINFATYIGATSVREMVIGYSARAPTGDELRKMEDLVEQGMHQGAMGLSTALEYSPAPYASTEELIALARVAARYGGIYATHMRDEGNAEPAALEETFRIGREAQIPIEIFHLKIAANETSAACRCCASASSKGVLKAWMWQPIPMRTRRGAIRWPHSHRPGPTTAVPISSCGGSRIRRHARECART